MSAIFSSRSSSSVSMVTPVSLAVELRVVGARHHENGRLALVP
eukprot:CAMPEP_0172586290 /NCGR_PEP_ID=MMETSP1068-20121228/5666_1 /TAXON_ID=35684 /ORGANISM="Pseudopedinella elastica, Strain CCMP716" /LENGTH=42 /DNA_ID= /DNA_START= /DNA_END= /DNA_ORIENTATION=